MLLCSLTCKSAGRQSLDSCFAQLRETQYFDSIWKWSELGNFALQMSTHSWAQPEIMNLRGADWYPLTNPFPSGDPTPDASTLYSTLAFDVEAFRFSINNNSFVPPTVSVLLQILGGAYNAHDLLPRGMLNCRKRQGHPSKLAFWCYGLTHSIFTGYVYLNFFHAKDVMLNISFSIKESQNSDVTSTVDDFISLPKELQNYKKVWAEGNVHKKRY